MANDRIRVAVLGGGVGALSAAFALSETDPGGDKYDITLYQLGWRLGGKTASGRNAKFGQRIEEHGLHIWAGFYENAFTIMRAALKALDRPPSHPLATIADAFKRQSQIFYCEQTEGAWLPWPFWFEPDADASLYPGRDDLFAPGKAIPPLATMLRRIVDDTLFNVKYYLDDWPGDKEAETAGALAGMAPARRERLAKLSDRAKAKGGHPLLALASVVAEGLESEWHKVRAAAEGDVIALMGAFHRLLRLHVESDGLLEGLRRTLIFANLGICMLLGILKNGCLTRGLEVLDRYELREFLAQEDEPAAHNAIVTALYEYIFAYEGGSRERPRVSACSAVQGLLRLFFTYTGAFFFKAVVGMGDTICTPIYQLLRRRGVTFKFFHKVTSLEPAADGADIGTILIDQQVGLVPGLLAYDPLVTVKGVECWPSAPLWDQIENGAALEAKGYNFESAYGPPDPPQPPPVARLCLRLGQDFDKVILAIPVGALAEICAPLVRERKAWADMVGNLATVRTQALQLWLDRPVQDLGGPYVKPAVVSSRLEPMGPIVTTCKPPLDTYADMSQLLPAEGWTDLPPPFPPASIAYFCAVMSDTDAPNDEKLAAAKVKEGASAWMTSWLHTLWPEIGSGDGFRWELLHSLTDARGPARLDEQFWRANIDPGERYVLSLPDTLKYRMEPGASGYGNLYLAGDWTRVPEINAGCVEVAAMSGLAAASALSGVDIPIVSGAPAAASNPPSQDYIDYGGWMTLPPPPLVCNDGTFYALGFHADLSACQGFVDRSYNRAAGRAAFRVMLDTVFLLIVQPRLVGAATPPFSQQGTMRENDIGFWLLVGFYEPDALLPSTIGWLPAYLLVDNALAVAGGREIFGFPKFHATMVVPDASPSYGPFQASALVVRHFGEAAQASRQQVLSLSGGTDMTPSPLGETADLCADVLRRLCAGGDERLLQALLDRPGMPNFVGSQDGLPIPVFFLKQIRSSDSTTLASVKAVLQGSLDLTKAGRTGWLEGSWTLELGEFDSLPFIRDLGLGTPTGGSLVRTAGGAFWAEIDFNVGMAAPIA